MPAAPATLTPLENEVLTLRDRVFELEEELRALREAVTPKVDWPAEWGFTNGEAKVLHAIHSGRGRRFNRQQLLSRVYGYDCEFDANLISVHVCRIKRKLRIRGLNHIIEGRQSYGYSMSPETIAYLDAIIAGEKAAALAVVPLAA